MTHYDEGTWVLESPQAGTIQLRATSNFVGTFSMVYPTNCSGSGVVTATMAAAFRHASTGDVLAVSFCDTWNYAYVGQPVIVTVWNYMHSAPENGFAGEANVFHCFKTSSNVNSCQRMFR